MDGLKVIVGIFIVGLVFLFLFSFLLSFFDSGNQETETSVDRSILRKYELNPVYERPPAGSSADISQVFDPFVLFHSGHYTMWYSSGLEYLNTPRQGSFGIEYATSPNGLDWSFRGVALEPGQSGDWDSFHLEAPSVLYDSRDGKFKMWYSALSSPDSNTLRYVYRIGYAESSDGISWVKYDNDSTTGLPYVNSDPVIVPEERGFDSLGITDPHVIKKDIGYAMWFTAIGEDNERRIGYAESVDGINWKKSGVSVLRPEYYWEGSGVFQPFVLKSGGFYEMWYGAYPESIEGKGVGGLVGYAVSKEGTEWVKNSTPVLEPGETGWDSGSALNPSVVKIGDEYTLYYVGDTCRGGGGLDCVASYKLGVAHATYDINSKGPSFFV